MPIDGAAPVMFPTEANDGHVPATHTNKDQPHGPENLPASAGAIRGLLRGRQAQGEAVMASPVADVFRQAADLIANDPCRKGNTVELGAPDRVLVAGDIHGHRQNLSKILAHAAHTPNTILILQEIIHGPPDPRSGKDRSVELMLRAARAKLASPESIYFVLGNHDLAQMTGNEITKNGAGVCKGFEDGIRYCWSKDAEDILDAVLTFCRSLPLAIRFDNGVMVSHSLPSPNRAELAGTDILSRATRDEDLTRGGPVYEYTWGRDQTPEQLDALTETLGVRFFILGHRHLDDGIMMLPNRAVAINSDGARGCVIEFSGEDSLDMLNIIKHRKPISALR
jgi:predicted phosphodiesterase